MIDLIIQSLESMAEDMEDHGETEKARGVTSALWLIEYIVDFENRKNEPQSETEGRR